MRPRHEFREIANRLTDSPTEADLKAAQDALRELMQERSKLYQRMLQLTRSPKESEECTSTTPRSRRSLREIRIQTVVCSSEP